jgi:hypothetical protein
VYFISSLSVCESMLDTDFLPIEIGHPFNLKSGI